MQTDGRIICLFPYFLSLSIKYRNLAILIGIRKNSTASYDVLRFADDLSIKVAQNSFQHFNLDGSLFPLFISLGATNMVSKKLPNHW